MENNGWIGVDLDATLAYYDSWHGTSHIGRPIDYMVQRVQVWLSEGKDVRIITARVSHDGSAQRMIEAQMSYLYIMDWCLQNIGQVLPITCSKDFKMIEYWDDRCIQVLANTGLRVDAADENSQ
jgi:hypothetical protein